MKNIPIQGAPMLGSCTMDLTENCNLACDYCFTHQNGNRKDRVMKEEIGKKMINWWLAQGPSDDRKRGISWWGGEPLLEWELLQRLTLYAEEIGRRDNWDIEFGGTTNGLLYTPEKYDWMLEHKCVMLLSLDGIQPAHDLHRKTSKGVGSWKTVDRNLREALKVIPFQKIRFSFAPDTVQYLYQDVLYFVEDLGLNDVAFSPVYEGDWSQKNLELVDEQFEKIIQFALKKHKEGSPITLKHFNDEAALSRMEMLPPQNPCGAGNTYVGWSKDGFMYPCHRFNKHNQTISNRKKHEIPIIASIYRGYVNEEFRKGFWDYRNNPPDICTECEIFRRSGCFGGCYGVNWDLSGDIYKPHPSVCGYAKLQTAVGRKYDGLAQQQGVTVCSSKGWDRKDSPKDGSPIKGCVCYNMCYLQGTNKEITHLDYRSDRSCLCYQSSYFRELDEQSQIINHEHERTRQKFTNLTMRILNDHRKKIKKLPKQRKLEKEVINKTIDLYLKERVD